MLNIVWHSIPLLYRGLSPPLCARIWCISDGGGLCPLLQIRISTRSYRTCGISPVRNPPVAVWCCISWRGLRETLLTRFRHRNPQWKNAHRLQPLCQVWQSVQVSCASSLSADSVGRLVLASVVGGFHLSGDGISPVLVQQGMLSGVLQQIRSASFVSCLFSVFPAAYVYGRCRLRSIWR